MLRSISRGRERSECPEDRKAAVFSATSRLPVHGGWPADLLSQASGKLTGPLQIPFVRVAFVEAAGQPQRSPGIESSAGKLTDEPKALVVNRFA